MKNRFIILGIMFVFFSGNSFAGFSNFNIDNKFDATFPQKPSFTGEIGSGKQKYRSYNYTDEKNIIVYTATYQVGITRFRKSDISEALNNYVKGQSFSVNGSVKNYREKLINGNKSAIYFVKYNYQGTTVRKYGVVSYKNGHFFQWSVQDFPSLSNSNGNEIFTNNMKNFIVK